MSKQVIFDPKELRSVRDFIADGSLPYHPKTVERFCRDGVLPAIKVRQQLAHHAGRCP
jgi:hypothetical protein